MAKLAPIPEDEEAEFPLETLFPVCPEGHVPSNPFAGTADKDGDDGNNKVTASVFAANMMMECFVSS